MKLEDKIIQIVKFIAKEIVSFFIKGTLFLFLLIAVVSLIAKYSATKVKPMKVRSIVEIDLGNFSNKKLDIYSILNSSDRSSFLNFLTKLDSLKSNDYVEGVFLKIDDLDFSSAEIEEIAKKIDAIKRNDKKVYIYANHLDNKNYLLAIHGSEIIMPPTATSRAHLTGYYNELAYYGELSKNLGIEFNVIHVGDYKSYGENYTRNTMSKEYKENLIRLYDKVYNNFVENVVVHRGINKKNFTKKLLQGDFVSADPFDLEKAGLIDSLKYETEIRQWFMATNRHFFPIEDFKLEEKKTKNKIAVVYLSGVITENGKNGEDVAGGITPDDVLKDLDKIEKDKDIKGVVIRIDSGGGSAFASNVIARRIEGVGELKPVYISIGSMAASGGYYIASSGSKIFADNLSITGSIGVVSLIPNFQKIINNVGVNIETVKKGEYSDLYSMSTEFSEKDRQKIYDSSYKVYDEFLDIVAYSRYMEKEDVHKIAQGKVWLGKEAKENGLVDEIGGIEETIEALITEYDIDNYSIIEFRDKPKVSDLVKSYFPFLITMDKINNIMNKNNELYFKPLYYFPYKID